MNTQRVEKSLPMPIRILALIVGYLFAFACVSCYAIALFGFFVCISDGFGKDDFIMILIFASPGFVLYRIAKKLIIAGMNNKERLPVTDGRETQTFDNISDTGINAGMDKKNQKYFAATCFAILSVLEIIICSTYFFPSDILSIVGYMLITVAFITEKPVFSTIGFSFLILCELLWLSSFSFYAFLAFITVSTEYILLLIASINQKSAKPLGLIAGIITFIRLVSNIIQFTADGSKYPTTLLLRGLLLTVGAVLLGLVLNQRSKKEGAVKGTVLQSISEHVHLFLKDSNSKKLLHPNQERNNLDMDNVLNENILGRGENKGNQKAILIVFACNIVWVVFSVYLQVKGYTEYMINSLAVTFLLWWLIKTATPSWSPCKITITDKRIYGYTNGREINYPISSITAVEIRVVKNLIIHAGTEKITFYNLENARTLESAITLLLTHGKGGTASSNSNLDEIKKLKELLDIGVITQEEFDAKKKQLLGL